MFNYITPSSSSLLILLVVSSFLYHSHVVLATTLVDDSIISNSTSPLIVRWNSTVDCTTPHIFECNFNNSQLWIGGVLPMSNQTAIIDYSNVTSSAPQTTQFIHLNQNITLVSLVVLGGSGNSDEINLLLSAPPLPTPPSNGSSNTSTPTTNSIYIQLQSLQVVSSTLLLNNTNINTTQTITLGKQSLLYVGQNSTVYANSINGSTSSTIQMGVFSDQSAFKSSTSNITCSQAFSVNTLTASTNTYLSIGIGMVLLGEVQSKGTLEIIGTGSVGVELMIGPNSNLFQLVSNSPQNVFMVFGDGTYIGNINVNYQSSIEVNGAVTFGSSALLNNTDITINSGSSLVLNGPTNLGAQGGINVEGNININHHLQLGAIGLVIRNGESKVNLGNTLIMGSIYLENGTVTVNQTQVSGGGCFVHSDGVLFLEVSDGSNQLSANCYQQTQPTAQLWIKDIEDQNSTPYISAETVTLAGQLLFSIENDDISPTFSSQLITCNQVTGEFSLTDPLNGDLSKKDYRITFEQLENNQTIVSIDFDKQNTPPKAPLWKIFLIIIGAIGGIFVFSYLVIKVTKYVKLRRAGGAAESINGNNYQYSQL